MKINTFLKKINSFSEEVKKASARAMFYAGFAMQSTEKQFFVSSKDEAAITQTLGAHTTMGQLLGGVESEQTKILHDKYVRILNDIDHHHVNLEMGFDKEGNAFFRHNLDRSKLHTKETYFEKLKQEWYENTDKSDDYPIELGLLVKRTWLNVEDCTINPETKKEYSSNFYTNGENEAKTEGCSLDEVTEVIHVKSLDYSNELKLIECYTSLKKTVMPYYYYQGEESLEYLRGLDYLTLIKKSHNEDEIFLYKIKEFKEIKKHNGRIDPLTGRVNPQNDKLLIKFIAENILKVAD